MGPRQVGKTTLISQLVKHIEIPFIYESDDSASAIGSTWLEEKMDVSINNNYCTNEAWLHLDLSGNLMLAWGLIFYNKIFYELPININTSGYEDGVYTVSIIYNDQIYSYEITIKH